MNKGTLPGFGVKPPNDKPIRTVTLTSGTGTFTPLKPNSWCRLTLVAGGAGGSRVAGATSNSGGQGGGAGQALQVLVRVAGATQYSVGAAGLGATAVGLGTSGGSTTFGSLGVLGGSSDGTGGHANREAAGNYAAGPFIAGGGGGRNVSGVVTGGRAAGFPHISILNDTDKPIVALPGSGGAGNGGGGGGSSLLGRGGDGGNGGTSSGTPGGDATGYGGGGGGGGGTSSSGVGANGGNASPGVIIIEELGP